MMLRIPERVDLDDPVSGAHDDARYFSHLFEGLLEPFTSLGVESVDQVEE